MFGRRAYLLGLLLAVGLIGGWWSIRFRNSKETESPSSTPRNETTPGASVSQSVASLGSFVREIRRHGPEKLLNLRGYLASLSPEEASGVILTYLKSGEDSALGLSFALDADGSLKEAPTLRLFLMDWLERINPEVSTRLAREILQEKKSPDEYALALRNLARNRKEASNDLFLLGAFREMLQDPRWRENPSAGFLEAFDLPVFLGSRELVPDLARCLAPTENRSVSHAAFLALDRMVQSKPETVLPQLLDHPEWMQERELTRANLLARIDVRSPAQARLLENYLLAPWLSPRESQTFAAIFPNQNYMVSPNLLTRVTTPGEKEILDRDRATLSLVETWLADPRFESRRDELSGIASRLRGFLGKTNRSN